VSSAGLSSQRVNRPTIDFSPEQEGKGRKKTACSEKTTSGQINRCLIRELSPEMPERVQVVKTATVTASEHTAEQLSRQLVTATRHGAGHVSNENKGFWKNEQNLDVWGDAPEERGRVCLDEPSATVGRNFEVVIENKINKYLQGAIQEKSNGRVQDTTLSRQVEQLDSRMSGMTVWARPLSEQGRDISPSEFDRQVKVRSKLTDRAIHKAVMDDQTLNIRSMLELAGGGELVPERHSKRAQEHDRDLHNMDHFIGIALVNDALPKEAVCGVMENGGKRIVEPSPRRMDIWQAGGGMTHLAHKHPTNGASAPLERPPPPPGAYEAFVGNPTAASLDDGFTSGLHRWRKPCCPRKDAFQTSAGLTFSHTWSDQGMMREENNCYFTNMLLRMIAMSLIYYYITNILG
jgi:hypothetical protein